MANILAVDDQATMRKLVEFVLTEQGHTVYTADNPEPALKIAREHPLDLVITDINMPGGSGLNLTAKLRRIPNTASIPILIMTTDNADYKKEKAKNSGASGWIEKPFTPERLIKAVNKMTGQ
jgi:two-component system, chemotaxis family, chemotaxis protein CheY